MTNKYALSLDKNRSPLLYFSLSDKECESLLPQNAVAHNGDGEEDMDVEDPSEQHTVLHRSKATAVYPLN